MKSNIEATANTVVEVYEEKKRIIMDESMSRFTGKTLEDNENEEHENDVSSMNHDEMKSENDREFHIDCRTPER